MAPSPKIVANLWFIKHSNGLFYYGLDYARHLGTSLREVWVRSEPLANLAKQALPEVPILVLPFGQLPGNLRQVRRNGDLLFTPSSHPLSLSSRMVTVVHDSFPFEGRVGSLKKLFFRAGLKLTGGKAAYINRADGLAFLKGCGIPEAKTHYLPNKIARLGRTRTTTPKTLQSSLAIGLFGTDSPKKNYDELFSVFAASSPSLPITWRIYGHFNAYTDQLLARHSRCAIEIVDSDSQRMDDFIQGIDIAVSVAVGEGFARPVALSLLNGVPTLLLDTPVFREFYEGSAQLFPSVEALIEEVAHMRSGDRLERPDLVNETALRDDFESGVAWLKSL